MKEFKETIIITQYALLAIFVSSVAFYYAVKFISIVTKALF